MSVYIRVDLQREIRTRFADCCAYCCTAEVLTVTTFEFEHITPRSAGGETVFENLCLACPSCNRYKAQRQTASWSSDYFRSENEPSSINPCAPDVGQDGRTSAKVGVTCRQDRNEGLSRSLL